MLPVDPAPGYGGLLLAGIVASYMCNLDDELAEDLAGLIHEVGAGRRVPQPVLRHRLQVDRIGLSSSVHRLRAQDNTLMIDLAEDAPPLPQILAAVYRVGQMDGATRRSVMTLVRSATAWTSGPSPDIVGWLTGADQGRIPLMATLDPTAWALDVFGLDVTSNNKRAIQRRFRSLLREAHPDHGGDITLAAAEIERLNAARQILLARGA